MPHTPDSLSAAEARRASLAAQGFSSSTKQRVRRPFDDALARLHVLQIDSVNVFARSHYLPVFSRQGRYDRDQLDLQLWESGEFTEYWAHEAAFIPVSDRPLFGWRMAEYRERHARDERVAALQPMLDRVRAALADGRPQFVRELEEHPRESRGPWWDWSDTKRAVEIMFARGEVVSSGREGFQRRYALAEHALPDTALLEVSREDAQRQLIERASRSLGVGTLADLADSPRLTFDQGANNSFYFAEEILSTLSSKQEIRVSDRATIFNLMIGLDGYTISTGIISDDLDPQIVAIPLDVDERIEIGWIGHSAIPLTELAQRYLAELRTVVAGFGVALLG